MVIHDGIGVKDGWRRHDCVHWYCRKYSPAVINPREPKEMLARTNRSASREELVHAVQ